LNFRFDVFLMNSKNYNSFHIISLIFVSILILGRWAFVITEDRAVVAANDLIDNNIQNQETQEIKVEIPVYDNYSDDSFQKYLGNGSTLQNTNYIPLDLEPIDSSFTANSSKRFSLRKDVGIEFADLAWHFWNDNNWDKLMITSAYRSSSFQDYLLKKWCSRAKCALAGSSEHQLWLAIDLGVMTKQGRYVPMAKWNKYYNWMLENAKNRWFHNTYQKWIEVDGQMEEWWHWRYLWKDLANKLADKNLTFGEWMKTKI